MDSDVSAESVDQAHVEASDSEVEQTAPAQIQSAWHRHKIVRWLIEWIIIIMCALLAALIMRTYVFETFYIPSGSMEPTLQQGDMIIVSKLSVDWGTINRGDILVFSRPPAEKCGGPPVNDLVKRVVGLPGDHIWSVNNTIYYSHGNGASHRLKETWTHIEPLDLQIPDSPGKTYFQVPKDSYYMMGDNHPGSCDSRYWGPLKRSYVVGKVFLRVWPLKRISFL